ncbi:hypothetical protein [Nocardioides sp.]|uniref:hypothetical protein n=1 Tax=Nocardioides sp. TaxID=35761 RepID=UPI0026021EAE|nr:hypothetical protein [Nocardioides sp.]MDI6912075.1 hypothetical protein [Nocardioides sp.]
MTTDHEHPGIASGRQIRLEPVRPGVWLIILGVVLAALGPLFGFLLGSMIGIDEGDDIDAIYLYLFAGIVIGGIGVGVALLGARRVLRDRRAA